jgi:hypothetical protein
MTLEERALYHLMIDQLKEDIGDYQDLGGLEDEIKEFRKEVYRLQYALAKDTLEKHGYK